MYRTWERFSCESPAYKESVNRAPEMHRPGSENEVTLSRRREVRRISSGCMQDTTGFLTEFLRYQSCTTVLSSIDTRHSLTLNRRGDLASHAPDYDAMWLSVG